MAVRDSARKVKVWNRGQMTIPADLRRELDIDDDTILQVVRVGRSLVMTPEKLLRSNLARKVERERRKKGISLQALLKDLKGQRKRYLKEEYGIEAD